MSLAFNALQARLGDFFPEIGLVLGSGLGFFADEAIKDTLTIPYEELPDFPTSTVSGHAGRFVAGVVGARRVLCMQGRFHYYEGYRMADIVLPIRLMARLGIRTLILTNAAGGINRNFRPGTLMALTDHINFLGTNPLIGPNDDAVGTRFPDMSEVYSPRLRQHAADLAARLPVHFTEGVYLATTGPSFETPAEIEAFRILGADAVGMSTVPEAIVARHAGMEVCALSCITNLAAGMSLHALTHEEVTETANSIRQPFAQLIQGLIEIA